MFNQAATTGSSLAGNYAVRQAVDVGTDTVLDTVQAVARGEDVNAKTIGKDLLANTLMAGAQVAGGSGKNGIVDTGTGGGNKPANMSPEGAGRKGAFKEAKRKNGIPVSEQPKKVGPNINKQGKQVPGRQYEYENGTIIRDDASGHIFPDNPTQNRGPHFNDNSKNHYDY
ncbi:HNH/endonuclease VII fold putative polymorphic toxin [Lachnospiraceae bacterium 50-23]